MKRIAAVILTMLMLLTFASAHAETIFRTEIPLELGSVAVFYFGDISLHAYNASDEGLVI